MKQDIPWNRFGVEAIVIVASILFAFAIDAWWESRQERYEELRLLRNLQSDFIATRNLLDQELPRHESFKRSALLVAEYAVSEHSLPEPEMFKDVGVLIRLFITSVSSYPITGALDGALASGNLEIIQNDRLRGLLAGWPRTIQEFREQELATRSITTEALSVLVGNAGVAIDLLAFTGFADDLSSRVPKEVSDEFIQFIKSPVGQNYLVLKAISEARAVNDGETLMNSVEEILQLINQELGI